MHGSLIARLSALAFFIIHRPSISLFRGPISSCAAVFKRATASIKHMKYAPAVKWNKSRQSCERAETDACSITRPLTRRQQSDLIVITSRRRKTNCCTTDKKHPGLAVSLTDVLKLSMTTDHCYCMLLLLLQRHWDATHGIACDELHGSNSWAVDLTDYL